MVPTINVLLFVNFSEGIIIVFVICITVVLLFL